jgi:hypothetical protein
VRISKQIRSVTAKFPAQRNRELLLLEQGILNNGTGNVFAQSGNRCRSTPIAMASCRKTSLRADAGGHRHPRTDGYHTLAGLSPEIGFFAFLAGSLAFAIFGIAASCHAERIRRSRQFSLAGSPLSNMRSKNERLARPMASNDSPFRRWSKALW